MPPDFADFLDDLGSYIEQGIARLPAPLAEKLSKPDTVIPTQELLHLLSHPEEAGRYMKKASGSTSGSMQ